MLLIISTIIGKLADLDKSQGNGVKLEVRHRDGEPEYYPNSFKRCETYSSDKPDIPVPSGGNEVFEWHARFDDSGVFIFVLTQIIVMSKLDTSDHIYRINGPDLSCL